MEVSNTYDKTNAHNVYCPLEYFHLYSVQALESLGSSRVQRSLAREIFRWLNYYRRYFYTLISLTQKICYPTAVFQIRVMITSLRYIVTSLTPPLPLIDTWQESLPSSHFKRSAFMHTCSGEKKPCLSLLRFGIHKTSTKRPQVTSYVLVTFCDLGTLIAACASSALSANLSSVFTQCRSTRLLKTRCPNISLVESPIRIQNNNKNSKQRNR